MRTKTFNTKIMVLLFCLIAGNLGAVSVAEKKVDSKITDVTVYQNRAKITREVTLSLSNGDYSLLFENIPILSDETSFHASADGNSDPRILGLSHQINEHLKTPQEKVANLEKEITDIEQGRLMEVDYRLAVLERKREFLLSLLNQSGQTMTDEIKRSNINATSWNDAYQFFGDKLGILSDSLRQYRLWSETLKDSLRIQKREVASLRSTRGNRTRTVQVDLRCESEGEITIALDYIVSNAGWVPIYDARLNSDADRVELEMFAEVTQKTGEDWEDVKLTFSTAHPGRSAGPGQIGTWFIEERTPVYSDGQSRYKRQSRSKKEIESMPVQNVDELLRETAGVVTTNEGDIVIRGGRAGGAGYIVDGVRIGDPLGGYGPVNLGLSIGDITRFAANFETNRKETIISGEKTTRAPIATWELEAKTSLICRPKLNQAVFRQVEVTNQFDFPLLRGQVSLFAGSDFIGKTSLNSLIAPGQTFDLPFGVNNNIDVKRKLVSNKRSVSDDRIKINRTIEIKIKNWSNFTTELALEESFPVSQDNRIKTKYKKMNPKPDEIDKQGKANWKLILEPGEEKVVSFTFEISHPKEMRLSGI
ncbi:MAG: mucoidy inhibitor MuiA family protein [candidate division Zixibacteria bacterium]|nr:mucoidy inhibitor MuiA family protein [candidate division Zixibacteria bacterium]